MFGSALISWLHLLGVALGLGSVVARGYFLRATPFTDVDRQRALNVDGVWGLAAIFLLSTGPLRAFGGFEKGFDYYQHSALFWLKLTIVVALLCAELWPMIVLIKWRVAIGKGQPVDTSRARLFGLISYVEGASIIVIMLLAAFMARGFWQVR
jgi:putative membrane protein